MSLDPFDLRGPQFLLFYAVLLAVCVLVTRLVHRYFEQGESAEAERRTRQIATAPYSIAFLRGGRYEVVRVALLSLLERGLMVTQGDGLCASGPHSIERTDHPIEKAILSRFAAPLPGTPGRPADASAAYADTAILAEADLVGESLEKQRLIASAGTRAARMRRVLAASVFLWVVAGVKVFVALSRGRTNIGFLLLMAALSPVALVLVSRRFRTALGDQVFTRVQSLLEGLRGRRDSLRLHQTSSELAFLAAAFGMSALSAGVWSEIAPLQARPPTQRLLETGTGGTSCGGSSSCGSASSCGSSSCGGGSCGGGGCGGCGGG